LIFYNSQRALNNDTSAWTMAECMQELVLTKTHLVVQSIKFIFVSIDEITIMHYQRWIIIHVYVVEAWKCIPILLTLE
jgi:nitric oxide reductase large subunit